MRIEIEVLEDNLLRVKVGSDVHTATEAHITFDGPMPILTLSHALQDLEPVEPRTRAYLDGTPR